ncbi:hypothetical protein [Streptomyces sp. WMMB303]|uniref:hypothetical protein n=1 Tax=Streptomyces sp. WMMB303 TaxID=3034154 RepID=UPI0023EBC3A8|nr:hypothetical protein [Streptomyces sp. WMMB303]MDF4251601.1 hypothetical protein [Streptomyces sp. WMMB303]
MRRQVSLLAFADPQAAAEDIDLAEQLPAPLDMLATKLTVRIGSLARDAGRTDADIEDRAHLVRTEAQVAGVREAEVKLELALALHHAVRNDQEQHATVLDRLRELSEDGAHAHYIEIARFMAGLAPIPEATAQWIEGTQTQTPARALERYGPASAD